MPDSPTTVLVVDDERAIRRFLKTALEAQGYALVEAGSGEEGLRQARHHRPAVVLLDLGLPDRDGIGLIAPLRELCGGQIMVLTSRGDEASKVTALDAGADDYLTKPFGVPELSARIRAALRHRIEQQGGSLQLELGPLAIDLAFRHVRLDGAEVHLSPKEWAILEQLAIHAGKVVTHRHIVSTVWGRTGETEQHYLRVYMRQLRHKLEPDPSRPALIQTEPGVGYRLMLPG